MSVTSDIAAQSPGIRGSRATVSKAGDAQPPPGPSGAQTVLQLLQAYQSTAALRAAIDLRIFGLVAAGRGEPADIAAAAGADARGTRVLLDALTALGLLTCDGHRYGLTPAARDHLVPGTPAYLGGLAQVFADDWEWAAFGELAACVRRGGTSKADHAETPEHPWWEVFSDAVTGFAVPAASALSATLAPLVQGKPRLDVLDLAAGNGLYGFTIATSHPGARVTALDWPNVIPAARRTAQELGVADRASFLTGDMFTVDLGGSYDLAVLSHVLHHFSEQRCIELLRRVASALRPGGRVVLHDFIAVDGPDVDPAPRLFSLLMLVWTRAGQAHALNRMEAMLAAAGFVDITLLPLAGLPSRLLTAQIPAADRPRP